MTFVDDLYEPADDREPGEPEPDERDLDEFDGSIPLDLEGLSEAVGDDPQVRGMVEALIAEVRSLRAEVAEWEALPTREEWATTHGKTAPSKDHAGRVTADDAAKAAEDGMQAWVRRLTVHPWEPVDSQPPF